MRDLLCAPSFAPPPARRRCSLGPSSPAAGGSSQEAESEKLKYEHLKIIEENRDLVNQNHKLSEEVAYAKELASSAAVELKNLAEEVTKLSVQNTKQAKELLIAQEMAHSRVPGRKGYPASRGRDEVGTWSLDLEDMKMELQERKQREAALEAALAEKELLEEECKKKFDEAKKKEISLENDLAGMWVLVAKLKRGALGISELNVDGRSINLAEGIKAHSSYVDVSSIKGCQSFI